jgi:hypothetical protein
LIGFKPLVDENTKTLIVRGPLKFPDDEEETGAGAGL